MLPDNILKFIVPDYLSLSSRQQILARRFFDAVETSDKPLAAMFHVRLSETDDRLIDWTAYSSKMRDVSSERPWSSCGRYREMSTACTGWYQYPELLAAGALRTALPVLTMRL
jgi:hypothetical protein